MNHICMPDMGLETIYNTLGQKIPIQLQFFHETNMHMFLFRPSARCIEHLMVTKLIT